MSEHSPQAARRAAPRPGEAEHELAAGAADQARGVRLLVLGAVVAVLAPLTGFLVGSMIGPSSDVEDVDAMFVSMFVGLVVGGLGAAVALLGVLRWNSGNRRRWAVQDSAAGTQELQ
jgi:hypothetical protein